MNDDTLGMSHPSRINGWRIDVLIDSGFKNVDGKELLLVGLITLLVFLTYDICWFSITMIVTCDTLYFLSGWDTLHILNVLVY